MHASMFGKRDLTALIERAKRALKAEEDRLTKCITTNQWKFPGRTGLCCNLDERFLQFLIWRELMSSFRWRPQTESQDRSDLAFYDNVTDKVVARAEIEGWWSDDGLSEIPGIRMDMAKLRIKSPGIPGVMLILTTYLKSDGGGFDTLAEKLGIALEDMEICSFDNSDSTPGSEPWEFSVVGFFANRAEQGASV